MMKSRLFGSLFLLLISSSTVSGLGSVVSKSHRHVAGSFTWTSAKYHCKRYSDGNLATIYRESDVKKWYMSSYYAWTSLHRDERIYRRKWTWADVQYRDFPSWGDKLLSDRHCALVHYPTKRVYGRKCEHRYFFFCQTTEENNKYKFIPESKTWSEARRYCKEHHNDLASFIDENQIAAVGPQDFPVWIGLHRDGGVWKWSTGLVDYSIWKSVGLGNGEDCVTISSKTKEMTTQHCNKNFPSFCMLENVDLIRENKTWEEALDHCRALTSPTDDKLHFDLLSLQPTDDHDYMMSKIHSANTEEVWTGLRFLAGEWLWVNGADVRYPDLPLCPALGHHCGALSKKSTGSLETRDCMERKNFLCYSREEP